MTLAYISKLGPKVHHTDIGAQKIDGSTLKIFGMVLTSFQVEDQLGRARFFKKTLLSADINMQVVLNIPFLTFSNVNIQFVEKKLTQRSYTTAKTLSITKQVILINKKEFAKTVLDENFGTFDVYVIFFNLVPDPRIYSDRAAQIASLLIEKVKIPNKSSNFVNIFSEDKALVLLERTKLNEHAINPIDGKQSLYGLIYNLGLVKLEILKTYIKTHLKTGFIQPSKFSAYAFILLIRSQMAASICVLIIKISTILQSKIGTFYS